MRCEKCGAAVSRILESRPLREGGRRRRKSCHSCGHRWTEYVDAEGKPCERPRIPDPVWLWKPRPRKLTEAEVLRVLTEELGDREMAEAVGVSRQMVAQIRTGAAWATFRPELPRRETRPRGRSCERCRHWIGTVCDFGFPDPIEEGPEAANDCSMYDRT